MLKTVPKITDCFLGKAQNLTQLQSIINSSAIREIFLNGRKLVEKNIDKQKFSYEGYCNACENETSFTVDNKFAKVEEDGSWTPNWRERVICKHCNMNNRHRLIASVIRQNISANSKTIYMMEQKSKLYKWVTANHKDASVTGSEYLGNNIKSGTTIDGIRHENAQDLSLKSKSFDLVISNDVFEHLPNPEAAFRECSRILNEKGKILFTIPFFYRSRESKSRAKYENGHLLHLLPPHYHHNPVNNEGCLVYTDFAWDILSMLTENGFSDAFANVYSSWKLGHPGGFQIIFTATK